jgi:hypothetical protein
MIVADVIVKLDKIGQDVRRKKVTPAEVAILVAEHHKRVGDVPVTVVKGTESEVDIRPVALYSMLMGRYAANKVKAIFPSASGTFPETFEEAVELGMSTVMPENRLLEYELTR